MVAVSGDPQRFALCAIANLKLHIANCIEDLKSTTLICNPCLPAGAIYDLRLSAAIVQCCLPYEFERSHPSPLRLWSGTRACIESSVLVVFAVGTHPFPFRTRKLSLSAPMILPPQGSGTVGRRQHLGLDARI